MKPWPVSMIRRPSLSAQVSLAARFTRCWRACLLPAQRMPVSTSWERCWAYVIPVLSKQVDMTGCAGAHRLPDEYSPYALGALLGLATTIAETCWCTYGDAVRVTGPKEAPPHPDSRQLAIFQGPGILVPPSSCQPLFHTASRIWRTSRHSLTIIMCSALPGGLCPRRPSRASYLWQTPAVLHVSASHTDGHVACSSVSRLPMLICSLTVGSCSS